MKSVGIKMLKDKLSSYLKLVRQGEVVLVTDRDEVIAEIRQPMHLNVPARSKVDAYFKEASTRGELRLASNDPIFPKSRRDLLTPPMPVDVLKLLAQTREERL